MFRKFSQWFDTPPGNRSDNRSSTGRSCENSGCLDEGIYRAPKSRYHIETGVDDWHWFCLIHIRDYNAKWNYYSNMSEAEIERERRADVTWQRPSWPLGGASGVKFASSHQAQSGQTFQDPFGLFNDPLSFSQEGFLPQSPEGKALLVMGLSYPFSQSELRKKYRELVKKHHPDTNGGTVEAVEMLKYINEAYEILKRLC
jgi:DnaJ-domain-containing protein 1